MFGFFKQRRRKKLRTTPFPGSWGAGLSRVPLYRKLDPSGRSELEGHVLVFLDEKRFEGCNDFEITDEVRVRIAAQACLLLLHRETDYYPRLHTVLVYPGTFVFKTRWREEDEDMDRQFRHCDGYSPVGTVVLAWSTVRLEAAGFYDGTNLVLHEFAHQLDQEDGVADGAPPLEARLLEHRDRHRTWARVFSAEYKRLCEATAAGNETVLNQYGAKHPAEFFAVATECFFENPQPLERNHPELYEELKRYYKQDPARWPGSSASPLEGSVIAA